MNPLLEMYADEFEEELITIFSYISEIVDIHQGSCTVSLFDVFYVDSSSPSSLVLFLRLFIVVLILPFLSLFLSFLLTFCYFRTNF
jgi:hypothetical protein